MACLPNKQVRRLELNEGCHQPSTIYRLDKGFLLHFVLGPSLVDKNVRVFVNQPADKTSGPNRNVYRELNWENLSSSKLDVYDNFASLPIVLAGSFNYYFTIDGSANREEANGSGYFLVDPVLTVGRDNERLSLDSITCQTVLSKNLGTFDEWPERLRVAKEAGYNMLHFTPIQELGASNSAYCLKDQLKLNPAFNPHFNLSTGGRTYKLEDVKELVQTIHDDWEMLSIVDLVFNHTANESPWIREHPECAFNLVNSPHLKPAYLLDRILWHFSLDVGEGKYRHKGCPPEIRNWDHLNAARHILETEVLPPFKLHEYYTMNVDEVVSEFRIRIQNNEKGSGENGEELTVIDSPNFMRLRASVSLPLAVKLYWADQDYGEVSMKEKVELACEAFREKLVQLNAQREQQLLENLGCALKNFLANAEFRFIKEEGPKSDRATADTPMQWNYFTLPVKKMTVEEEEAMMHTDAGAFCMAHNGWVMGDDCLKNFAEPGKRFAFANPGSFVYHRRELIPWGDSVKLRYGSGPADCPFLWRHMAEYAVAMADTFHGVRLDNCHSTPIHVAEYLLDQARQRRPDLYVIAELFTSSQSMDSLFINRLGLNSLIREGLAADYPNVQGSFVLKYGGQPVGAFIQPPARTLKPTMAHCIFFDQTHDNESPCEKRSALDYLPNAGIVAMSCCASGSNRGYDEMVPHHINVVNEKRLYQTWEENAKQAPGRVDMKTGIMAVKKALNKMHQFMGHSSYNQVYVETEGNIVTITRHNQVNHQSIVMAVHCAFHHPHHMTTGWVSPLAVSGVVEEVMLEARLVPKERHIHFNKDEKYINGLTNFDLFMQEHIPLEKSTMLGPCNAPHGGDPLAHYLSYHYFPPGSIIAVKVNMRGPMKEKVLKLRQTLSLFGYRMPTLSARKLSDISSTEIEGIAASLSLADITRVLFRCHDEEHAEDSRSGVYDIPGHGRLVYCGLAGVMSVLDTIREHNDVGHFLCENLRQGLWLCDYIANRLKKHEGTFELGMWFDSKFAPLNGIPKSLIPSYFDAIVCGVYMLLEEICWAKMSSFIANGASFLRALAMGSVQFLSYIPHTDLPPLSPFLQPPYPPTTKVDGKEIQACLTLCAGFPHFCSGYMRNWGRDTFISMRGLTLLTGRFQEARYIILGYAATLRHGLIPNLLQQGIGARYNCRDAVWWWLECIHQYINEAPNGKDLLNDRVARMYPTDDTETIPEPGTADMPLHQVIQEALQRHATGVSFRERNAGHKIDEQMLSDGFNVTFGIDWDTGFVYGGNSLNCGTWMDKMGSSHSAGNKGIPATPRDGSAIELVGLMMNSLQMVDKLNKSQSSDYPYEGVRKPDGTKITWRDWSDLIQKNFEKHFWVNPDKFLNDDPKLVNKTEIYKDTVGSSEPWTDYQLRPNQVVTMVVAPQLFTPERAWKALSIIQKELMGPLGIKTLDESDFNYDGYYYSGNPSHDYKRANGFNYHNGPEWLWPVGYFLRAKLHFAIVLEKKHKEPLVDETIAYIKSKLSNHRLHLLHSPWRSLPELTNRNGDHCGSSCPAQAWSVGCLIELLYDLEKYGAAKPR